MHPADHCPANPESFLPKDTLNLPRQAEVEATIASLKEHFERVRQHEVKRVRGRLGQLSSAQENAIESLSRSIIDQFLQTPIIALEEASEDSDSAVIETVNRVFNLSMGAERSRTV